MFLDIFCSRKYSLLAREGVDVSMFKAKENSLGLSEITQMLPFCVKPVVHAGLNGHFELVSKDAYIFKKI